MPGSRRLTAPPQTPHTPAKQCRPPGVPASGLKQMDLSNRLVSLAKRTLPVSREFDELIRSIGEAKSKASWFKAGKGMPKESLGDSVQHSMPVRAASRDLIMSYS